ncbi:hypothetical protein BKA56DRAFT_624880 [Ilyonectria sp. MPI-CAGE-AT-0026]|nr:hypothetical protein BKA56DRAFT_624880 [Ilyonectria sp. MPI-CAGE-AT-0026]
MDGEDLDASPPLDAITGSQSRQNERSSPHCCPSHPGRPKRVLGKKPVLVMYQLKPEEERESYLDLRDPFFYGVPEKLMPQVKDAADPGHMRMRDSSQGPVFSQKCPPRKDQFSGAAVLDEDGAPPTSQSHDSAMRFSGVRKPVRQLRRAVVVDDEVCRSKRRTAVRRSGHYEDGASVPRCFWGWFWRW